MLTTHINRALATIGITSTLLTGAWIGTAVANAQPAFCDSDMYIHACAGGSGGSGGSYYDRETRSWLPASEKPKYRIDYDHWRGQ